LPAIQFYQFVMPALFDW